MYQSWMTTMMKSIGNIASETAAVVQGLREKAAEFKKAGSQLYVKQ